MPPFVEIMTVSGGTTIGIHFKLLLSAPALGSWGDRVVLTARSVSGANKSHCNRRPNSIFINSRG